MGRVCSMESKATLPVLVHRAGREWQRLNFAALGKGKIVARSGEKRLVCIPTYLRYLLKEPPESPPSPVIRPKQHGKIAASTSTSKQYRSIRAHNTTKKSHHSLNQKLLSAQPTYLATHVVQKNTLPDLRQAYYKVNTHIKSTHRALLGQYI